MQPKVHGRPKLHGDMLCLNQERAGGGKRAGRDGDMAESVTVVGLAGPVAVPEEYCWENEAHVQVGD